MGERANIVVKQPSSNEEICLYSHWGGDSLIEDTKLGLIYGKDRWQDFSYLTRILFDEMTRTSDRSTTGFGISCGQYDSDYPDIYVNVDTQTVTIGQASWSFYDFTNL